MKVEWANEVCGIYFRTIVINKGQKAQQHMHPYDHATLVCSGAVDLYINGCFACYCKAGEAVPIFADLKHEFVAAENGTRLTCVHIAESAESAKRKELLTMEAG